jgi:hypothetical protein
MFISLKKKLKSNMGIVQACKFSMQNSLYCVLYKKKSDKIWRLEYSDPHVCLFCVAKNMKYLKLMFCTFVG